MSAVFRPLLYVMDKQGGEVVFDYPTYAELKKDIPNKIIMDHDPDGLFVVRAKYHRNFGTFGEYVERWETCGINPKTGQYKVRIKRESFS
jgi:hypothetical protein